MGSSDANIKYEKYVARRGRSGGGRGVCGVVFGLGTKYNQNNSSSSNVVPSNPMVS